MAHAGNTLVKRITVLAALFVLPSGITIASEEDMEVFGPQMQQETIAQEEPAQENNEFGSDEFSHSVTSDELDTSRGEGTTVFNKATLTGNVSGNTAENTVSGANQIAEGALSGVSGVATVIQNSGNNVLIQSDTIVNVNLQ